MCGWSAAVHNSAPLPCLGAAPLLRHQAVWSPPVFTACVCDLCRVRVLVRLSHPRPPDRSQHGCTVGVDRDPPVCSRCPSSVDIGRRAPTCAVLTCAALWCLVVRPRCRVDMVTTVSLSILTRTATCWSTPLIWLVAPPHVFKRLHTDFVRRN